MSILQEAKEAVALPLDDAGLVRAARRDPAAFAALYRRYVGPVYRYLYSRLGHTAEAEDLTAQVFSAALQALPQYRERERFAAWLFAIARRRLADHYRSRRQAEPLDERLPGTAKDADPLAHVLRAEALERLAALVVGLGEAEQEMLRLRFAGGLSYAEMAQVLGKREGAVKMAMHRLLRRLEEDWEGHDA